MYIEQPGLGPMALMCRFQNSKFIGEATSTVNWTLKKPIKKHQLETHFVRCSCPKLKTCVPVDVNVNAEMKSLKEFELHGDQFPEMCVQEIIRYKL